MKKPRFIQVGADEMKSQFYQVLLQCDFREDKAMQCAEIFTSNSVDGVYTHGVNRFPTFVRYVKQGLVNKDAEPSLTSGFGCIEQWNGALGPGPLNAIQASDRAMHLAQQHGIGCVAMANTNHWMRGGYYGWHAAKKGLVLIAWTNTIANMPAWTAIDKRLGNNPLVIAVPYMEEAIVLDMAMSQFSFGAMEMKAMQNEKLPVYGGYDKKGNLSSDPSAIIESGRLMPAGYWKGAGLSLLLDILSAVLSGGLAVHQVTGQQEEYSVSQVFICLDVSKLPNHSIITTTIHNIILDYHQSITENSSKKVVYPGERVVETRRVNLANGIPVLKKVWEEILRL